MKFEVNIEKKYAYVIMGLLVLILGFLIVGAYGTSNPAVFGHSIGELSPPSGCSGGQVLGWSGNYWQCVDMETAEPTIQFDLVYGLHSSAQCTSLGGTVRYAGEVKVCSFPGTSCAVGFTQYLQWSATSSVYEMCDSSCMLYNGYPGYQQWTGPQECNTGGHTWSNNAIESCTFCKTCSDSWTCSSEKTIYATRTQIGCY